MSLIPLANLFYETRPTASGEPNVVLHAMPVLLGALCVLAIAYRYYSAFLAAKVAVLDDARPTPSPAHCRLALHLTERYSPWNDHT